MIAIDRFTPQQRDAVEAPFEICVAIAGDAGTGKSEALRARALRYERSYPDTPALWLDGAAAFGRLALRVLAAAGRPAIAIDDVEAEAAFASACAPLFAMDWEEIASQQLDPEVPGLRSPGRFLESAFRLIRRLRDARIDPEQFLTRALSSATEFYAKPPNFADPHLLAGVKESDRSALAVTPGELERQYRREIDLAKVLSKLYARYRDWVESNARMTGRDAIDAAIVHLRADAALAGRVLAGGRVAFVDNAGDATAGAVALLCELFGGELAGVTFAGDAGAAVPAAALRVELQQQHRCPPAVELACRFLTSSVQLPAASVAPCLTLYRAPTRRDEAAFIAATVRGWLDDGTPPERVAVLFRSTRAIEPYENALLDRDVAPVVAGDVNVFADRRALDALALLWNAYDPFAHEWLLRTLANPAFGLSDASLALLCGEPPSPQSPLFVFDDEPAPTLRASRWDPKRDLRLGWNVVRGDRDAELSAVARERIERFRARRLGWIDAMHREPFDRFAQRVWREGLAREGLPGSARALAQQAVLRRLLQRLVAFAAESPGRIVADMLQYARERGDARLESCEDAPGEPGVRVLSVEAARGREFDHVVVADVRAGAFPRWYAPDAFSFAPRYGMIPKENAGDAPVAKTAKFVYCMYRSRAREKYNARERRAFVDALRRARCSAVVTASQTPTRGAHAPEFFEELRRAKLPGVREVERGQA
ncbi:MAG TPA: 3'-5' exonuclease [Candidatus Tumulicola sp.]|nr:3'-5' exonuclease [Candidatus Tumulicola sp.]